MFNVSKEKENYYIIDRDQDKTWKMDGTQNLRAVYTVPKL